MYYLSFLCRGKKRIMVQPDTREQNNIVGGLKQTDRGINTKKIQFFFNKNI